MDGNKGNLAFDCTEEGCTSAAHVTWSKVQPKVTKH